MKSIKVILQNIKWWFGLPWQRENSFFINFIPLWYALRKASLQKENLFFFFPISFYGVKESILTSTDKNNSISWKIFFSYHMCNSPFMNVFLFLLNIFMRRTLCTVGQKEKKKETPLFISIQVSVQKRNWYQSSWISVYF